MKMAEAKHRLSSSKTVHFGAGLAYMVRTEQTGAP
jgi:hypothetical protein